MDRPEFPAGNLRQIAVLLLAVRRTCKSVRQLPRPILHALD